MSKKNEGQDQETTEVTPVETQEQQDGGEATQEDPNRVANPGEVSDPGNSGLLGENFTEGSVTGNADKPNG